MFACAMGVEIPENAGRIQWARIAKIACFEFFDYEENTKLFKKILLYSYDSKFDSI